MQKIMQNNKTTVTSARTYRTGWILSGRLLSSACYPKQLWPTSNVSKCQSVKIKHFYLLLIVQELEIGLIVNTKLLLFKTSIIIYITEWEKQAWVENTLLYNLVSQNGTHLQRYFSKVFGNDILNCSLCRGQIWKLHQIICSISINIKLSFKSSSSLYNVQVYI